MIKRRSFAQRRTASVGEVSEERKKKQSQDIVERHNDAGGCIPHVETLLQDQRNQIVIDLPENTDGHKGKTDQYSTLII